MVGDTHPHPVATTHTAAANPRPEGRSTLPAEVPDTGEEDTIHHLPASPNRGEADRSA
jgi:hypothetical protein